MSSIEEFQQVSPSTESYWRSIILFGLNIEYGDKTKEFFVDNNRRRKM